MSTSEIKGIKEIKEIKEINTFLKDNMCTIHYVGLNSKGTKHYEMCSSIYVTLNVGDKKKYIYFNCEDQCCEVNWLEPCGYFSRNIDYIKDHEGNRLISVLINNNLITLHTSDNKEHIFGADITFSFNTIPTKCKNVKGILKLNFH